MEKKSKKYSSLLEVVVTKEIGAEMGNTTKLLIISKYPLSLLEDDHLEIAASIDSTDRLRISAEKEALTE